MSCNICDKPLSAHRDGLACCPWCGGEATLQTSDSGKYGELVVDYLGCRTPRCFGNNVYSGTVRTWPGGLRGLIAAYNDRAKTKQDKEQGR